jgi:hypothetical protein
VCGRDLGSVGLDFPGFEIHEEVAGIPGELHPSRADTLGISVFIIMIQLFIG